MDALNLGALITAACTLVAAIIGIIAARITKRTREPLSWEAMLDRLAEVERQLTAQRAEIDSLRTARDQQDDQIRSLKGDVTIYREAFRAVWMWHDRLRRTMSTVPEFTAAEQQAIDVATQEPRHALPDDPWKRSALPPRSSPA